MFQECEGSRSNILFSICPIPQLDPFIAIKVHKEKLIKAPPHRGFIHSSAIILTDLLILATFMLPSVSFNASKFDLEIF